jgi:membrane protein insertase Oxa1/YidC/SpoIIIJ
MVRMDSAGAVEAWLLGKLRLFLEWLTVPMLLVALQLPHAPLVYWLSSGLATLGQQSLLRLPAVRYARLHLVRKVGCTAI